MQDNDINNIMTNALIIDKTNLKINTNNIISSLKKVFESSRDLLYTTCLIDLKNNNGSIINYEIIENIFNNFNNEDDYYGKVTLSSKEDNKKIIYGKEIMDVGNVVVITDGNPYVTLEILIKNILAGNTTIIVNNGYMYGTNHLIVKLLQDSLEKINLPRLLVQLYVSENYDEVLCDYANINLVVCIGNHNLQQLVLNKNKNKIILSGYENFDIYIDDKEQLNFINEIINTKLNIQLYINSSLKIDQNKAIIVDDIDEAISQINYNGSKYSAAIFTKSKENASKFIKEVKSKIVTVNTSPTIERIMDIKVSDLVKEKKIIYPLEFKIIER